MKLKKAGKALLFPPAAVLIILTPIAAAALVYSMLRLGIPDDKPCAVRHGVLYDP